MGIFDLEKAIQLAQELGLDLIKVTDKIEPPVCKIEDYGKFVYQEKKKERQQKVKRVGELKNLRLGFNISEHDLTIRTKTAEKFFKKGYKIRVEIVLKGREKHLAEVAKEKIKRFLEILEKLTPFKIERELKKESRGLTIIITKN